MPKIFQYLNYSIYIYTNNHLPLHVHIFVHDRQVKAELIWIKAELKILFKKIKGYQPLTNTECKEVAVFIKLYEKKIKEKWDKIMYYNQPVKAEIIKKKIKITGAVLIEPFVLKVLFNNSEHRIIDFKTFFCSLKGYYKKWNKPSAFEKFKVENGELRWGKNADVQLHPIDIYYNSLLHPLHDELTENIMIV